MPRSTFRSPRALALLAGAALVGSCAKPAAAQISYIDLFRTGVNQQTADGNTVSPQYNFIGFRLYATSDTDFTGGTVNGPGSGATLTPEIGSPSVLLAEQTFADQAAMDAAFPTGAYTYTGTGGTMGPASATINYAGDVYPGNAPYLTGSDYSMLQGIDTTTAHTLHLSPFATDPNANFQYRFLTLYDLTAGVASLVDSFLPNSMNDILVPANTMTAGDNYLYEIIDSNRVIDANGTGTTYPPQLGFDLRTTGTFTTKAPVTVPEPGSLAMLAGLGVGAALLRRRRTR